MGRVRVRRSARGACLVQVPGVSHPCGPLPGRAFETAAAAPGAEESAFAARRWTTKAAKSSSPGSIAAVVRVQGHEVGHGRARVGGRRTAVRAGETNGSLERLGLLPAHELAEVTGAVGPPAHDVDRRAVLVCARLHPLIRWRGGARPGTERSLGGGAPGRERSANPHQCWKPTPGLEPGTPSLRDNDE